MGQFLIFVRRHWQAVLALCFFTWRLWRGEFSSRPAMWVAVGLAVVGLTMNLVVILINRGMPARVSHDEISEDEKLHYHPISQSTRLAVLSDWIPLGNLLISPGDIVLFVAVAILLLDAVVGR